LGHVSRCVPIAQNIVERGGTVVFSTYHEAIDYVKKYGLPVVAAPPIQMENDPTGSIDIKGTTIGAGVTAMPTIMEQIRFEIRYMKTFKPHVVFSDSRLSTIYAARLLKLPVVLLLNQFLPRVPRVEDTNFFRVVDGTILTLLGRSWTLSDVLVIPDFPEPYTISLDSLRIPRRYGARVNLVGCILPRKPEDNDSREEIRESMGVEEDQILVYAGISGPRSERMPLIELLVPIFKRFPERYKVVMSMGVPGGGSEAVNHSSLTLIPWMENRFEYLNACDLVISRGGHETIMQSICYGKPSIIVPVPKHPEQYGNARRAMEMGVAKAIHQRNVSLENLVQLVDGMVEMGLCREALDEINSNEKLDMGLENTLEVIHEYLIG
jgi:uncharacterized protein (TIGR00661 family)